MPETYTKKLETMEKRAIKSDETEFAVKIQSKFQLIKSKQQDHLFNEIELMNKLDHPFILPMRGVSQDKRCVFMYIDLMPCGDLMGVINEFESLDVKLASFYGAQVVTALEYMHGRDFIFRDLKPENVLVSMDGYLKLADFGFIKHVMKHQRTSTFCGTPEYIAPEIILNKGYSHPVDWYAMGIFLYEMLVGRPPFMSQDTMEIFEMTMKGKIKFPRDFDSSAKSLIKKLTKHDLSERYGNLVNGVQDIKKHRFFKNIDWDDLLNRKITPPHIAKPKTPSQKKKEKPVTHKYLPEGNDNKDFPPIKVSKDPFLNWF